MNRIKKLTAAILSILILSSICVFGSVSSVSASGTGAGLAEWALNAYYSGWSYVYGGATPGAVDCSGLIYSYCGGERCGNPQLNTATETGSVSNGIPRVHGLGLWRPGHVGVYIADNMEVDARGDEYGVCYESIGGYNNWTYWFKLAAVSYPTNGWEKFNGDYYYYENGQYIVNTSRTIDGTTYYFDSKGRSGDTPSDTSSTASDSSSGSSSSSSSSTSSAPTSWKKGSTGEEVTKIQNRLIELGYLTGTADGSFGEATEEAYKAFQAAAGVTVDGIAGSDRDILYSDDAPYATKAEEEKPAEKEEEKTESSAYQLGDESDKVTEIQAQLAKLGYFDIEADGSYGYYTEQAVMNFQLANGLEATGIVDEDTYKLLFSDNATENPDKAEEATEASTEVAETKGPAELPSTTSSAYIIANQQNQMYADTASEVVTKTNTVTKKALSNSSSVIPAATKSEVKRTASVGLWFALVAVILGGLAIAFFVRDRKTNTRYARYAAKKKKSASKVSKSAARW